MKNLKAFFLLIPFTMVLCSDPESLQSGEGEETAQDEEVQLLFVQDARGVEFSGGGMTLKGIKPTTLAARLNSLGIDKSSVDK